MNERKTLMLEAGKELLKGTLSIKEAMDHYQVKDKRTMIRWAKRALQMSEAKAESSKDNGLKNPAMDTQKTVDKEVEGQQSEIDFLRKSNKELLRFQNTLTNRINDLEVLIAYAERTHKISIMGIDKKNLKSKK